ncbi:MAG: RsmD family RNA methyltransferase [candidate division Zixibacteria bacterium]|nr:RsmD family RNA methyltransferase [candidate division Zixibacteria bacterium]
MSGNKKKKARRFEFSIIAGSLKGKVIRAPDLDITRPPLSRLRKAIFDFLTPYLDAAAYLDLFSGTGSYLFEAVSRGAGSALGIERDQRLASSINQQAETLDVADRLRCLADDVFEAIPRLENNRELFDIIMIAPPQYQGLIDRTLQYLQKHDIANRDALLLCQHDSSETRNIAWLDYEIVQHRKYGNTTFTILRQDSPTAS